MDISTIENLIARENIDEIKQDYGDVKTFAQMRYRIPPAVAALIDHRFSDPEPPALPDRLERILIRQMRGR